MSDELVPVCRDCGVVCQYIAAHPDWGLVCPRCNKMRVSHEGLEPTADQAAYEARQRAITARTPTHATRAPRRA